MAKILILDDEELIRELLTDILSRAGHTCDTAATAGEARAKLPTGDFELVLADMNLPDESGLELLGDVLHDHRDMAAIMVTGRDDPKLAEEALRLGTYGYLIKPFHPNQLVIHVDNALHRRTLEIENRMHRERLNEMIKARTAELWKVLQRLEAAHDELQQSRAQTVERLSIAAEFRDDETARHIHRMSRYCSLLAGRVGWEAANGHELITTASVMHDVGKIGVPDNILLKPGPLTAEEFQIMKQHTVMGYRILAGTGARLLDLAAGIALSHHERVDGSGYPQGLSGDDIPLEGRIASVADVFDALTSDRIYRRAFPLGEAVEIMKQGRGAKFDPQLLDLFLGSMDEVLTIMDEENRKHLSEATTSGVL